MRALSLWFPVAVGMAAIFGLSSQPVLPGVSLLPAWLAHDWLHHGLAYAALGLVTLRALAGGTRGGVGPAALLLAWVVATTYGVTDEWHQSFVPGRSPEARDVLADGVGAGLALVGAWAWSIIKRSS